MELQDRVINNQAKFTDVEDEIVSFILKNRLKVSQMKIVVLANLFFVAPNTITRLCHKLGYSGFSELKHEIKHEIKENNPPVDNGLSKLLLKNMELIDQKRENRIIQLFLNSKKIHFFSIGQTAYATKILVDNFSAVEGKFFFYTYANELRHRIMQADNELFFFISLSGEKDSIIELAKLAKDYQQTVVSLTNITHNRLENIADYTLFCYSPPKYINGYNITDKTPLLFVMTSLFDRYISILT